MSLSDYENSYEKRLEEAIAADLSDLEYNECVSVYRSSRREDTSVVVLTPKLGSFENNEASIKRIFQLFIRKLDPIANDPFVVIYCHMTAVSSLSQKLLLNKYSKILPHNYHKNLKRLFIVHHQLNPDVSTFFGNKLTKLALKVKFFNKLVFVSSLAQLQGLVAPATIPFSYRLHRLDDQVAGLTFKASEKNAHQVPSPEQYASLQETFVPFLGTTYLLFSCIKFLRDRNAFSKQGLFRNSANDAELTTAKIRMQRVQASLVTYGSLKAQLQSAYPSVDFNALGDSKTNQQAAAANQNATVLVCKRIDVGGSPFRSSYNSIREIPANIDKDRHVPIAEAEEGKAAAIYVTDLDAVANIIKFSLRTLTEPLVTYAAFDEIFELSKRCIAGDVAHSDWLQSILQSIERMDDEHYSTFQHLFLFLAEVAKNSQENLMSAANLGTTFAPCVMRSRPSSPPSASISKSQANEASSTDAKITITKTTEDPISSTDTEVPPVLPPSHLTNDEVEGAYLSELAVCAFVVKGLIEHFVFLLDLKILDSLSGEIIITDNIGGSQKLDSLVQYFEKDVHWTENIVTKSDRLEASKM